MHKLSLQVLSALVILLPLAACNEGPGERAGRSLDNAGQSVRDAVDPPRGPVERMGRSIDRAIP
jgi:predicted small secreted protein